MHNRVQFHATPWTVTHRFLYPWNFSGKNTGVGCHFLPPGDGPDPGIKPICLAAPALAGEFFITSATWEAPNSLQFSSVAQSCPTLCNPMDCSTPGLHEYQFQIPARKRWLLSLYFTDISDLCVSQH